MSIDIDEVFVMELEREIKMLERIKSANLDEHPNKTDPPTNLRPIQLLQIIIGFRTTLGKEQICQEENHYNNFV